MMNALQKRPKVLTLICVLGFIGVILSIPSIFSPFTKRLGMWFPALFGAIVACHFIALIGIWHLKRWGVELYVGTFLASMIVSTLIEDFDFMFSVGLLFRLWFIPTFLYFYKRMDRNL
jgi:hypothetical protein